MNSGNPEPVLDTRANSIHTNFLRLKSGVTLTQRGGEHYLGLPHRGIMLTDPMQVQISRRLDGNYTQSQISRGLLCDKVALARFIDLLKEQGLIEESDQTPQNQVADLSRALINARTRSEQSLITHRSGVVDGGSGELRMRAQASILISGENQLARNLLIALQASGFTHTRLISRAHLSARINESDVCGIAVRTSDIGKRRIEFTDELIRNSQIAHGTQSASAHPDLIISTIPIEWDYVQRWMSEGSIHLHINTLIGPEIEVGPLVIPGVTPCLRCVTLIKRENKTSVDQEFVRSELPSAGSAHISGLIALAVAQYFATGSTPLQAASYWYDLLDPLRTPEKRHWSFHPLCGCQA